VVVQSVVSLIRLENLVDNLCDELAVHLRLALQKLSQDFAVSLAILRSREAVPEETLSLGRAGLLGAGVLTCMIRSADGKRMNTRAIADIHSLPDAADPRRLAHRIGCHPQRRAGGQNRPYLGPALKNAKLDLL